MEDYLAILQALKWAANRCRYTDVGTIGIRTLQEVHVNFDDTPASNIEPERYKNGGTEMLSFVYTGYYKSTITITPELPFVVYMHEGDCLLGIESNCSRDVIDFLQRNKQVRILSFNKGESEQFAGKQIEVRNKLSARELIKKQNAPLNFVENLNTKTISFSCGIVKGYLSPNAKKNMECGTIDDFVYAEVSINGKPHVPCLLFVKKSGRSQEGANDIIDNEDLPF